MFEVIGLGRTEHAELQFSCFTSFAQANTRSRKSQTALCGLQRVLEPVLGAFEYWFGVPYFLCKNNGPQNPILVIETPTLVS